MLSDGRHEERMLKDTDSVSYKCVGALGDLPGLYAVAATLTTSYLVGGIVDNGFHLSG